MKIGLEVILHPPARSPTIVVGPAGHQLVQAARVGSHYVLDVVSILQAAFDFKRAGTSIGQLLKGIYLTEVSKREQVTLMLYLATVGINEVELEAAELSTLAPVGTTAKAVLRRIAYAGIAHTERAMDKHLELEVRGSLVYGLYLVGRQLAGQYYPTETQGA